ncbi:MAG: HD-GYP domain-containing protein [Chloroflexota bacterium]|nr:HD-GYP domain-containing protein [Chloroflexota bacterium]
MSELRPVVRLYIILLALAAVGSIVWDTVTSDLISAERAVVALGVTALMTLAHLCPLPTTFRMKLQLDTSAVIAAVLLFEPGVAMLVVGLGTMLAQGIRRQDGDQILFNGAQIAIQAGSGALVLRAAGWNTGRLFENGPEQLLAALAAAGTMYLVNTFLVATIIGLESAVGPVRVWYRSLVSFDRAQNLAEVAQLGLGLLAAIVLDTSILTLPLLVVPALGLYRTVEHHRSQPCEEPMDAVVESLADTVDVRDPYTAGHSRRVAATAREIGLALGLPPSEVALVYRAARVHDVGKVAVDNATLSKQERLTADEWEQLRRHPMMGVEILSRFPEFAFATGYVRHHHERIDGSGYPDALEGDQIPLGARIIAVADAFDAMTTDRPYRPGLPLDVTRAELLRQRGRQWDGRVVDTLLRLLDEGRVTAPDPSRIVLFPISA